MTDSEQVLPDVRTAPLNELARQAASISLPRPLPRSPVLFALTSAEIDQAPEHTSVGVYSPRIMRTMPFTLPSPIQIFSPREVVHEEE